jgi:hypothetical protein
MIKWFAKANDSVISHCRCISALAATNGQLDCPWCGCGWMISCIVCRKGFIFARIVEIESTYEEVLATDTRNRGLKNVTAAAIADCASWMRDTLAPFPVGETIVYLDGGYFEVDARNIEFEGIYARHTLDRLPHTISLEKPDYLRHVLGDPNYWYERERPNRNIL